MGKFSFFNRWSLWGVYAFFSVAYLPTAFGASKTILCQSLFAQPSLVERVVGIAQTAVVWTKDTAGKISRIVPIVYFDVPPRLIGIVKPLDVGSIDQLRNGYKDQIKSALRLAQAGEPFSVIRVPRSNEEKLALIESVADVMNELEMNSSTDVTAQSVLQKLKKERQVDLTVAVSRWKTKRNQMSPTELSRLMDYAYLSANRAYFSLIQRPGAIFFPSAGLLQLTRSRWQSELAKHDLITALQKLNIVAKSDRFWDSFGRTLGVSINVLLTAMTNYQTLIRIGLPVFVPGFSFYQMPGKAKKITAIIDKWRAERKAKLALLTEGKIRQDQFEAALKDQEALAFDSFVELNRGANFLEYYKNWARRIWPFAVIGALTIAQSKSFNYMEAHMNHLDLPSAPQVVTRENLESQALAKARKQFESQSDKVWDAGLEDRARALISRFGLAELRDFLGSAEFAPEGAKDD